MPNMATASTTLLLLLFAAGHAPTAIADDRLLRTNSEHSLRHHAQKDPCKAIDCSIRCAKEKAACKQLQECKVTDTTFGWDCVTDEDISFDAYGNDWVDYENSGEDKGTFTGSLDEMTNLALWQTATMQWSPHWKCVGNKDEGGGDCEEAVLKLLPEYVEDYNVNFLNVGMMANRVVDLLKEKEQMKHMSVISTPNDLCAADKVDLWYNNNVWEIDNKIDTVQRCLQEAPLDRAFNAAVFHRKYPLSDTAAYVVIGAHLPHPPGGTSSSAGAAFDNNGMKILGEVVKEIVGKLDTNKKVKVIIIGDFNYDTPEVRSIEEPIRMSKKKLFVKGKMEAETFKLGRFTPYGLGWIENEKTSQEQPTMSSKGLWKMTGLGDRPFNLFLESSTIDAGTCCADQTLPAGSRSHSDAELIRGEATGGEVTGEKFFPFSFDRILSSFGRMKTILPLGKDTSRAATHNYDQDMLILFEGAFHKPIIGIIIDKVGHTQ